MRAEGLEPTRSFEHQDLNLACLPIPARPQPPESKSDMADLGIPWGSESMATRAVSKTVNPGSNPGSPVPASAPATATTAPDLGSGRCAAAGPRNLFEGNSVTRSS